MRFAANLGFLWSDLPVHDAVRAAANAGFSGVELHWRRVDDLAALQTALDETGLRVVSLNTDKGDAFGLSALPDRRGDAFQAIDQALSLASALDCSVVHVTSGVAEGREAKDAYFAALEYACSNAPPDMVIGIEPISERAVPGYYLRDFYLAEEIIETLERPNLGMIFDFYHAYLLGFSPLAAFQRFKKLICTVQVCGLPDRGRPKAAELRAMHEISTAYRGQFGCEYHDANPSLEWAIA